MDPQTCTRREAAAFAIWLFFSPPGRENELKGHLDAPENHREWLTQGWRARPMTAFAG